MYLLQVSPKLIPLEIVVEITLEVPDQYLVNQGPAEFAKRIKLYAALLMFQSDEISAGAAAELAEVDRLIFAAECQRHGIPLVDYPAEELRAKLAALRTKAPVAHQPGPTGRQNPAQG